MDGGHSVTHVAKKLPEPDEALEDPRLRPVGVGSGLVILALGAVLSVTPTGTQIAFWNNVAAATLLFVSVPLFSLGVAATEPPASSRFHLGIEFSRKQRHAVAAGSLCLYFSPAVLTLGSLLGLSEPVLATTAATAFIGAALVLSGFIAWTSETFARPAGR